MKIYILLCYIFVSKGNATYKSKKKELFNLVTDKKICYLRYFNENSIDRLRIISDNKDETSISRISDKIIWNYSLPKPYSIAVLLNERDKRKQKVGKIEFITDLNSIFFHTTYNRSDLINTTFPKGSFNSRDINTMKSIPNVVENKKHTFTVSDTEENLNFLKRSEDYCIELQKVLRLSNTINDTLNRFLTETRDFEIKYNDLAKEHLFESLDRRYSNAISKIRISMALDTSNLYVLRELKENSFSYEQIMSVLVKIKDLISEKIDNLKIHIKEADGLQNLQFVDIIEEFKKLEQCFSDISSCRLKMKEILMQSVDKSNIQDVRIKKLDLNRMVTFHRKISRLMISYCALMTKKYMENNICEEYENAFHEFMFDDLKILEKKSYDFVFMLQMKDALKKYESDPMDLKFIFLCENFKSISIAEIVTNLKKERAFYKKIAENLKAPKPSKEANYFGRILKQLELCCDAWEDVLEHMKDGSTIEKLINNANAYRPDEENQHITIPIWKRSTDKGASEEQLNQLDETLYFEVSYDELLNSLVKTNISEATAAIEEDILINHETTNFKEPNDHLQKEQQRDQNITKVEHNKQNSGEEQPKGKTHKAEEASRDSLEDVENKESLNSTEEILSYSAQKQIKAENSRE